MLASHNSRETFTSNDHGRNVAAFASGVAGNAGLPHIVELEEVLPGDGVDGGSKRLQQTYYDGRRAGGRGSIRWHQKGAVRATARLHRWADFDTIVHFIYGKPQYPVVAYTLTNLLK